MRPTSPQNLQKDTLRTQIGPSKSVFGHFEFFDIFTSFCLEHGPFFSNHFPTKWWDVFLAPTGALYVTMLYDIEIPGHFFRFWVSMPLDKESESGKFSLIYCDWLLMMTDAIWLGVEQILDFWQNLPEFPFSTRHYQWSFFFEFELGRFDHHIHWFFILANITGSHFNNFSISEIIFIFALCFLPISNPHPMIVHRKVKACDQKQRVSSRDQEFFWQKFLVFL